MTLSVKETPKLIIQIQIELEVSLFFGGILSTLLYKKSRCDEGDGYM